MWPELMDIPSTDRMCATEIRKMVKTTLSVGVLCVAEMWDPSHYSQYYDVTVALVIQDYSLLCGWATVLSVVQY